MRIDGILHVALGVVWQEDVDDLEAYAIEEFCAPSVDYSAAVALAGAGATSMCDVSDALSPIELLELRRCEP